VVLGSRKKIQKKGANEYFYSTSLLFPVKQLLEWSRVYDDYDKHQQILTKTADLSIRNVSLPRKNEEDLVGNQCSLKSYDSEYV
jgi:hypothetical protein